MSRYTEFEKEWIETGGNIANGEKIHLSHILAIRHNLQTQNIKPEFLPGPDTIGGTPSKRKDAIFNVAQKLWGLTPEEWLTKEKKWLVLGRRTHPTSSTDAGKDEVSDVISAEILIRFIATTRIVYSGQDGRLIDEALFALNLLISEACAKGRTRLRRVDDITMYKIFKESGLAIGSVGGKYLPNPNYALPQLLLMLHRDKINPDAYQK